MKKVIAFAVLITGVFMSGSAISQDGEVFGNGVRWKAIHRDYTETVSLVVFVRGGVFRESADKNGIGALFCRVWLKSGGLLEKVEYVGGSVNADLSHDYLDFSLSVPTAELNTLLTELRRQILSPAFSPSVFQREQDLTIRELEAEKDDPNSIAFQLFMQNTYRDHPYALKAEGSAESVSQLTVKDVREYYQKHFYGSDMIVVLAGKFTAEQEKQVKEIFRAVPKGNPLKLECKGSKIAETTYAQATDARIQQAKLFLAYGAPSADSSDYIYHKLLSDLLGGGMSSPYFTALRKEKGYAYSVGSMYPSRLCTSRMIGYIGLQPENIDDAVTTMQKINQRIGKEVTADELEKSKNHIIGQVLSDAETNSRAAWYAAFFENLGLGFSHMEKYVEQLKGVTKENIRKATEIFTQPYTVFVLKPAGSESSADKNKAAAEDAF